MTTLPLHLVTLQKVYRQCSRHLEEWSALATVGTYNLRHAITGMANRLMMNAHRHRSSRSMTRCSGRGRPTC